MSNILVIPDIHGRKFWKEVTQDITKYDKVVFLGDYIDMYGFECISKRDGIENFKEIIEFKKANPDKVELLLGNHDLPYYNKVMGYTRYDNDNHEEIEIIFEDERDLFNVAYETEHTLFTHSGCLVPWVEMIKRSIYPDFERNAECINNLLSDRKYKNMLNIVGYTRGGTYPFGSCVWADVSEHSTFGYGENEDEKYQVFGHTLQVEHDYFQDDFMDGKPIINKYYAMLDCRHAFEYDEINRTFVQL